jgi:hypothetical protein
MRIIQILSSIAGSICISSIVAQETDIRGIHSNDDIDEIVVVGVKRCGSWPIEHYRFKGCEYVELRKEELPTVLRSREEFFSTCLECQGSRCVMKDWPEHKPTESILCKRLFRTPTRVPRFLDSDDLFSPFTASFTFSISIKGKVEDIELVSLDGDIDNQELLRLIEDGAARTRFEPIVVADKAYKLVGLHEKLLMSDF